MAVCPKSGSQKINNIKVGDDGVTSMEKYRVK